MTKVAAACIPLYLGISATAALAAPPVPLDPTTIPKYVTDLVIPGVMKRSDDPGVDYQIAVRQFKQQMLPKTGCDTATQPAGTCTKKGAFKPTKTWGYGPASDTPPKVAPVPAAKSQFNNPSFTVEVERDQTVVVDWINDLVDKKGKFIKYDSLGLAVDQTLHWANPAADCYDGVPRTDCAGVSNKQYKGPIPMVTHVHGAHTTPESDGYTEAWYLPDAENINCVDAANADVGKKIKGVLQVVCEGTLANGFGGVPNTTVGKSTFTYTNDQPSTTLWYHDHSLGLTRLNVYGMGAGFWLIRAPGGGEDGLVGRSTLPGPAPVMGEDPNFDPAVRKTIREIPLAIQDKSFYNNGALFYPENRAFFEGLGDGTDFGVQGNILNGLDIPFMPDPTSDIAPIWNPEVFFNTNVVNGVVWPKLDVEPENYRFRMLNAANGRFYNMAMHIVESPNAALVGQEVPFYQIGAEQSLLRDVVKVWTGCKAVLKGDGIEPDLDACPAGSEADDPTEGLLMGPAERADVVVNFRGLPAGTVIRMTNTAPDAPFGGLPDVPAEAATTGQVMEFHVIADDPATVDNSTAVDFLRINLPEAPAWRNVVTESRGMVRDLALIEEESHLVCVFIDAVTGEITHDATAVPPTCDPVTGSVPFGPMAAVLGVDGRRGGTVQLWDDPIAQDPIVGTSERWQLWNWSADAHPIHIHLVKFRVLGRWVIGTGDPDVIMPGDPLSARELPEATELGWKDTVIAYPGEVTTVAAKFDIPGLYVWHCHLLEHEDNEMMVPYCVKNPDGSDGPGCAGL
ncbi:MAG: multicopper oxidase domain-containing protein [Gammaproteobacteria bacterium]|nr:multicopper oxidase domain-containing protein [Gammaproteobacteria bacterium]